MHACDYKSHSQVCPVCFACAHKYDVCQNYDDPPVSMATLAILYGQTKKQTIILYSATLEMA